MFIVCGCVRVLIYVRLAGHVARVGTGRVHTGLWWGNLTLRDYLEDLSLDEWIILKWTLKSYAVREWIGLMWLMIWPNGSLLRGNFVTRWRTFRFRRTSLRGMSGWGMSGQFYGGCAVMSSPELQFLISFSACVIQYVYSGRVFRYISMPVIILFLKHVSPLSVSHSPCQLKVTALRGLYDLRYDSFSATSSLHFLDSEISPTRCNNCVYSSQLLYSTCFGWQFHPSSGVQCCIWPLR